jgi:MerR family transcriptional regulator, light-induced transcriptional regulator
MSGPGSGLDQAYLAALLDGDRRRAFRLIDEARAAGSGIEEIYVDVFQPALREIGRLWQQNRITVADEHLATAITQAAMARLYDELFSLAQPTGPTLVAACADVERHEVGLRMLCDLLELQGWDTTYLGGSVPVTSLVRMLESKRPDVLALSATLPSHLPRLRAMILAVRAALGDDAPTILVGGRPFIRDPTLCERLGGDLTARDAREAVERLASHAAMRPG